MRSSDSLRLTCSSVSLLTDNTMTERSVERLQRQICESEDRSAERHQRLLHKLTERLDAKMAEMEARLENKFQRWLCTTKVDLRCNWKDDLHLSLATSEAWFLQTVDNKLSTFRNKHR